MLKENHWSGFKLILLVGLMVDFLVKKRQLLNYVRWGQYDMAPCRRQLDRLWNLGKT
jgi:hypothetical protein